MDWLNENARRAYPFVRDSAVGGYLTAVVDALFILGADYKFSFAEETAAMRLISVVGAAGTWVLTFRYVINGVHVSGTPDLVFTVPVGAPQHTVLRAATAKSSGILIIGDPTAFVAESPGADLEARVIVTPVVASQKPVTVYNSARRPSYQPFFKSTPGKTPAQNFLAAKAAAPSWVANSCLLPPAGQIPSGVCVLKAGFNVEVTALPAADIVELALAVGSGPFPLCGIYAYVKSKLGTRDPEADLNGDGIVDSADLAIAADLSVGSEAASYQTAMRFLNGVQAPAGDLTITGGKGVTVTTVPDQNMVVLAIPNPNPTQACVNGILPNAESAS